MRLGRNGRFLRLNRNVHDHGRGSCRRSGDDGRRFEHRLDVASAGGIGHLRTLGHLVAEHLVFRQVDLVGAHALDGVFRSLDVRVRHDRGSTELLSSSVRIHSRFSFMR